MPKFFKSNPLQQQQQQLPLQPTSTHTTSMTSIKPPAMSFHIRETPRRPRHTRHPRARNVQESENVHSVSVQPALKTKTKRSGTMQRAWLAICTVLQCMRPVRKRPFVPVVVANHTIRALYDTGSGITLMSLKEFRAIPVHKRPSQAKKEKVHVSARGAAGGALQLVACYDMEIEIFGLKQQQLVYVCKNLSTGTDTWHRRNRRLPLAARRRV